MAASTDTSELNPFERAALWLTRTVNEEERTKRLQTRFLRTVTYCWARPAIIGRLYVDGIDWLTAAKPDRGVVLVANHRSFFDMYTTMLALFERESSWIERLYFPVRANFFYEHPLGMAVNLLVGGGVMYPPIFRNAERSELDKDALARVGRFLSQPGTIVGMHPEGTRGKGEDPYSLLPAQPGVGQIVLQSKPIVVPLFINGLPNDIVRGVRDTYRPNVRRDDPVIICFGREFDYGEFTTQKPRAALYKRCADKMLDAIRELGDRERSLRAACRHGEINDDDPGWLFNSR